MNYELKTIMEYLMNLIIYATNGSLSYFTSTSIILYHHINYVIT